MLCDVTDTVQVHQTIDAIERDHGPIDLAILNAGGWNKDNLGKIDFADLQRTYDLNVFGIVRALEKLVPIMKARGRGHIALTASIMGYRGAPLALPYSSSKAAVISMAETLKSDLSEFGVKVQVIVPGFVKTPLTDRTIFPMPALMEVDDAARVIVRGLKRRQFEIALPWRFIFWIKILRILPYRLFFPLVSAVLFIAMKKKRIIQ